MENHVSVWGNCLRIIKQSVDDKNYKTWFAPIKPIKLEGASLTIQVPNHFFYDWLEDQYVSVLKSSVREALGDRGRLEYQILSANSAGGGGSKSTRHVSKENDLNNNISGLKNIEGIVNPFALPGIQRVRIEPQLNPQFTFENYIQGECNALALNAGLRISQAPGNSGFNPLFIFGGVGVGKTHLAQAIGNQILKKYPGKNVLFVQCVSFANQVVTAIKNNAVNDLVHFYQLIDVLIIDDIQILSGKLKIQEIFFNIFNQLHNAGKQLVFTCDRAPSAIEGIEDRLLSRFKWGLCADINRPDYETRRLVFESHMLREGLVVRPEIIDYICSAMKSNFRELLGVITTLIAKAMLQKKEIDMAMAREVVSNHVQNSAKEINVTLIKNVVTGYFNVSNEELSSAVRKRPVVMARQLAMYFCKTLTDSSLKVIGAQFGNRDHSTVIHSVKTVIDTCDVDEDFKKIVATLEDKIKTVANG